MHRSNYLRVTAPESVEVQVDDAWYEGTVGAWRQEADRWLAFVHYRTAPGSTYLAWVDAEWVRRVDEAPGR